MAGGAVKVLVTGGTSGLGHAMAAALAGAGASVALTGRSGWRASEVAALASEEAAGTHDERIIAIEFSDWLRQFRSHRSGNNLR